MEINRIIVENGVAYGEIITQGNCLKRVLIPAGFSHNPSQKINGADFGNFVFPMSPVKELEKGETSMGENSEILIKKNGSVIISGDLNCNNLEVSGEIKCDSLIIKGKDWLLHKHTNGNNGADTGTGTQL